MKEIIIKVPIELPESGVIAYLINNYSYAYWWVIWIFLTIVSLIILANKVDPKTYEFFKVKFLTSFLNIFLFILFTVKEEVELFKGIGIYIISITLILNAFVPKIAVFFRYFVIPFLAIYTWGVSLILECLIFYFRKDIKGKLEIFAIKSAWENRLEYPILRNIFPESYLDICVDLAHKLKIQTNEYDEEKIYKILVLVVKGTYKFDRSGATELEIAKEIQLDVDEGAATLEDIVRLCENYTTIKIKYR